MPALVAKVERLRAIQQAAPSAVRLREPAPMPDHIDRFASTEDPNAALSRDELRRGITTLADAVESTRVRSGRGRGDHGLQDRVVYHTFNPWWGCARVSPGCRFCYAERDARRYGHQVWGRHGPRRLLSEANWRLPLRWDRDAERAGVPALVFCASMADVFEDHPQVVEPRQRLWRRIEDTPHLRWLLLTKRPENVPEMVPWATAWPEQVWLGTSVETQRYALQQADLGRASLVRFTLGESLWSPSGVGWLLWFGPWVGGMSCCVGAAACRSSWWYSSFLWLVLGFLLLVSLGVLEAAGRYSEARVRRQ